MSLRAYQKARGEIRKKFVYDLFYVGVNHRNV